MQFQPFMIGRQFGIALAQPPNWMVTGPSTAFSAVTSLTANRTVSDCVPPRVVRKVGRRAT